MKLKTTLVLLLSTLTLTIANAQTDTTQLKHPQPPIPIEIVVGQNYSAYQSVLTRPLFNSKFNFYNLTYLEIDYIDSTPHHYFIQTIVSYSLPKGFNVGVGANLQPYNPFKPLIAVSYMHFTENLGIIIQPTYEIHTDAAFELYAMFEWTAKNKKKIQPYFKFSMDSTWKNEHVYSYHFWRLGMNYNGFRIGPALNVQYYGANFSRAINMGGFINVLL